MKFRAADGFASVCPFSASRKMFCCWRLSLSLLLSQTECQPSIAEHSGLLLINLVRSAFDVLCNASFLTSRNHQQGFRAIRRRWVKDARLRSLQSFLLTFLIVDEVESSTLLCCLQSNSDNKKKPGNVAVKTNYGPVCRSIYFIVSLVLLRFLLFFFFFFSIRANFFQLVSHQHLQ